MKTVEFLDAVKARHKLATDYKLAKFLGWNPARIAQYRISPRELDDEGCVQIATALGLPPPYVMACVAAARAKDAAIKKHWLAAARLLKTGTAAVILVTAGMLAQNAPSASAGFGGGQFDDLYIMRRRRRRASGGIWRRRRRRKTRTVIVATANVLPAR